MSKFYFVLSLILIFLYSTKAQSRFPLNPKSAWRIDSIGLNQQIAEKKKFFIQGDTIINSIRYYKLYKTGLMMLDEPFYYNNIYAGAIRDADNKIFFINNKTTKERFLYDFNLTKGEVIKSEIAHGKAILSIDTLKDGRKLFNYDFFPGYIIEGIGTDRGLFSFATAWSFLHFGFNSDFLLSYCEDEGIKYQKDTSAIDCDFDQNGYDVKKITHYNTKVYPVPTEGWLNIESDNDNPINSVLLYDVFGKKLLEIKTADKKNVVIDLSGLANGMYILRVNGNKTITNHSIIKE